MIKSKIQMIVFIALFIYACVNSNMDSYVIQFWNYNINKNYYIAWDMLSQKMKKDYSKQVFAKSMSQLFKYPDMQIKSFKILSIKYNNNIAIVKMRIIFSDNDYDEFYDQWIKEGGLWKFNGGGKKVLN